MTLDGQLNRYHSMTEDRLRVVLDGRDMPALLRESMAYSTFAGGKRLRPALCMAACEMLGGAPEDALAVAAAVELIHTYSLIHDDLPAMDNDDMRRGKPSNHIAFGEGNAILAGDGLLSLAFCVLSENGNMRALQAVSDGAFDMVAGQSLDLGAAGDEEALLTIHRLKTGALIRAAVLGGAYSANPTRQELYSLEAFAGQYGLLFQITDDILDVEGEANRLGKTAGKDADAHKLTFVTLYGLDAAKRRAAEVAGKALDAVEPFSERAGFYRALVDYTLTRRA